MTQMSGEKYCNLEAIRLEKSNDNKEILIVLLVGELEFWRVAGLKVLSVLTKKTLPGTISEGKSFITHG
jgi:hypothetical protein